MSTDTKLEITSLSSEQTNELGIRIGQLLKGGEVVVLESDLGGGKTTLTKAIAKGAGSKDIVSSPTFTISKEYSSPKLTIKHYDFYRLQDPGILAMELSDDFNTENTVTIIEWADIVKEVLPKSSIYISLEPTGDNSRKIIIEIPKQYNYIYEAIK